ncbi:hypothetical protein FIBSPDRAFT_864174 [Athelia psychrophila]|uniref:Uncharacterized protein n=1 Tax=Athelia psychrophila TaxID=1759441 RepID=A0A166GPY9_9AGAM|nr:hypothetical protein FIBSPDRAFT_864174 [Fibularhizoctonia sp. CBS 109695]
MEESVNNQERDSPLLIALALTPADAEAARGRAASGSSFECGDSKPWRSMRCLDGARRCQYVPQNQTSNFKMGGQRAVRT